MACVETPDAARVGGQPRLVAGGPGGRREPLADGLRGEPDDAGGRGDVAAPFAQRPDGPEGAILGEREVASRGNAGAPRRSSGDAGGLAECPSIAGRLLPGTSPAQAGVADVLEKRDGHRDTVESVVVSRVLVEHCGDGDLRGVQRVLEQPPAPPRAVDAALIAGVHEAAAGAGIDGQVHADAEQLALLADAVHVLAFGDAFAQSPQLSPLLRGEQVDECHGSSSGR